MALRCPRLFHFRYVQKVKEPEVMPETRIGKAIHAAIEAHLMGKALVDANARKATVLKAALGFVTRAQNLDGGYPQRPGGQSNAQSTAWAAQGLLATGHDPALLRRHGSRSPIGYLESLVSSDGSIRVSDADSLLLTTLKQ